MHEHRFEVVSTFCGNGTNGAGMRCECGEAKIVGIHPSNQLGYGQQSHEDVSLHGQVGSSYS